MTELTDGFGSSCAHMFHLIESNRSRIGVHTDRAIKAGATREEVAEALGVAIALNAGAALAYSARVLDAYAAIHGAAKSAAE